MARYLVFVDAIPAGVMGFGLRAAEAIGREALDDRRMRLLGVAALAIANKQKEQISNIFSVSAATDSTDVNIGQDVIVLPGVDALICDDAVLEQRYFASDLQLTIIEDREVFLPEAVTQVAMASSSAWHVPHIGAQAEGDGGAGVLIGFLDTGIDADHPEFSEKTVHFAEFDRYGKLISNVPRDAGTHGTHVAGIAAGRKVGVAPGADIAMAAVLTGPGGSGQLVQVVAGLDWLITAPFRPDQPNGATVGVDVVNASLGAPGFQDFLRRTVQNAQALGILTIAAAGNDGLKGHGFHGSPGNYPECLGVGATDVHDVVADFSDWGDAPPPVGPLYSVPGISAPGHDIYSALPGGAYGSKSGTSMAAPVVAGVAALRMAVAPALRDDPQALALDLVSRVAPCQTHARGNRGGAGRIRA